MLLLSCYLLFIQSMHTIHKFILPDLSFLAMSALFGLTLFIATQDIPRKHWLFVTKYGWSFGIGWLGMLGSMISGVVCISLPKYAVQ